MKNILITGANRLDGIGFHAASSLLSLGHRVIITARNADAAKEAVAALGERVRFVPLDLDQDASIDELPNLIGGLTDSLDVLINNAGVVLDSDTGILNVTRTMFEQTFRINTIAPVLIVQKLLPLLNKSNAPRIIYVSSGAGQLSDGELSRWAPAYSASKAALNALTQQLTASLPNFAVNSVCPGWCRTNMGGSQAPRTPSQGADTIVWLAVEAPHKVTGRFLRDREDIPW